MPIPARRGSRTPAIAHQPPEPCQLRSLMTDDGPPTSIDQFIPGLYRLSTTVSGCRRPTPDTWNLERPACFEIVPTAARSGAADKSALPATTPSFDGALTREYREIVRRPGFSSKAEPGAISSS